MFRFSTSVESPLQYWRPLLDIAGGGADKFVLSTPEYYRVMERQGYRGLGTYGFWVPSERQRAGRQKLVIE